MTQPDNYAARNPQMQVAAENILECALEFNAAGFFAFNVDLLRIVKIGVEAYAERSQLLRQSRFQSGRVGCVNGDFLA